MKPVNLLPSRYRPSVASGGRSGSSYVVLGMLGALLIGVLVYVFTANQITSREDAAAEASTEAAEAEARAGELAPFGDFAQLEQTRVASVRDLAGGRVDWERLARETAHVLPRGVRLDTLEGSTGEGATASAPATAAPTADGTVAGPTVIYTGCATTQPMVAKTLVRLRRLNGAESVTLQDSTGSGADAAPTAEGSTSCPGFTFSATVELAPTAPATTATAPDERVPVSLGGGQ